MWLLDKIFRRNKKKIAENYTQDFSEDEFIEDLKKLKWEKKKWITAVALVEKNGSSVRQYIGQNFDEKYFEIKEDAWTHDHCEICYTTISEGDDNTNFEIEGFNHDNKWICNDCFNKHIEMNKTNNDK